MIVDDVLSQIQRNLLNPPSQQTGIIVLERSVNAAERVQHQLLQRVVEHGLSGHVRNQKPCMLFFPHFTIFFSASKTPLPEGDLEGCKGTEFMYQLDGLFKTGQNWILFDGAP